MNLTPDDGYFLSRIYCDHYNCTCPHGIKGTDPDCDMHGKSNEASA
jgi:hypothetical protein